MIYIYKCSNMINYKHICKNKCYIERQQYSTDVQIAKLSIENAYKNQMWKAKPDGIVWTQKGATWFVDKIYICLIMHFFACLFQFMSPDVE